MPGGLVASILHWDFTWLGEEVRAVEPHVDRFQNRLMEFAPNLSFDPTRHRSKRT
jgi:hypothetical protein